jgi:hypothetical protein
MTSNQPHRAGAMSRNVDPFAAYALAWPTLSPDETEDALAELEDWIDWLRDRYHLDHRHLPGCWAQHGELVEELSALHTAWQHSYQPDADGGAPLRWHEAFDLGRQRLLDWVGRTGCRPGQHRSSLNREPPAGR